jgi:hypothetical protein
MPYKIKINTDENNLKNPCGQMLSILGNNYFGSDLAKITPVAGKEI